MCWMTSQLTIEKMQKSAGIERASLGLEVRGCGSNFVNEQVQYVQEPAHLTERNVRHIEPYILSDVFVNPIIPIT